VPGHGVTVGLVFRALHHDPGLLPRLLEAGALPGRLRARAERRIGQP
jgi:hypothetical protein